MSGTILRRRDRTARPPRVEHYSSAVNMPIDDRQFDALCSFTFNLGSGALQRSTLRRKVNYDEHGTVPDEFRRWVWAGGRKLTGLVRRREAEARLYAG